MKVFRCKICGETYLGTEMPSHCPYCGAPKNHLVDGHKYVEPPKVTSPSDRKNLEASLPIEVSNSEFYFCAARNAENEHDRGMFKRLAKVELEHADVLCKALGRKLPDISKDKTNCGDNQHNINESNARETRAIAKYSKFFSEAKDARAKEIFGALIVIEKTHLDLTEERKTEDIDPATLG